MIEIIEDVERSLQKPVVTSNQAVLWGCLRRRWLSGAVGRLIHRCVICLSMSSSARGSWIKSASVTLRQPMKQLKQLPPGPGLRELGE